MIAFPRATPRRRAWIEAATERDFAAAERAGNAILAAKPDDRAVRVYLARLLAELGRESDAFPHWRNLCDRDPDDLEAAYHVGEASSKSSPRLRENLRAVLEQCADESSPANLRHVAICGLLWCGSTLMDHLLGSLPGVLSTGESHYLPMARHDEGSRIADFSSDVAPRFVPCTVCGAECAVFTPDFRRSLAADRTNWFTRIARRLGTEILVSADKVPARLIECDPLLRFDALVLFKTPSQAWLSKLRKLPPDREAGYYLSECDRHMDVWARTYRTFLDHFCPAGDVAFVCFDELARRPKEVLERLCNLLSLPFDAAVLGTQRPGHAIAGNHGTIKKLRQTDYRVEIVPLDEPELAQAQNSRIARHAEAQDVFARLQSRFEALMRG